MRRVIHPTALLDASFHVGSAAGECVDSVLTWAGWHWLQCSVLSAQCSKIHPMFVPGRGRIALLGHRASLLGNGERWPAAQQGPRAGW